MLIAIPPLRLTFLKEQAVASAQKPVLNIEIKSLSAQNRSLYPQQELEAWFACVSQHGFRRHLILHRRNGLRRLVSHLLAQRSGVFVQTIAMPQAPVQPLQVETSAIREGAETHGLIDWLRLYETTHRELCEQLERFCSASNLMLPLQLVYEDHIERAPTVAYERVCGWLGVEPEPVELQHRRINSQPLSQVIANWDEIQRLVQPTPYAWMLAA